MTTLSTSRRSRFAERFLVEEREMSVAARRRLLITATTLTAVGTLAFTALTVQVVTGAGLAALDPTVAE